MSSTTEAPPDMSATAIIERLKQENALRLQLIKDMKHSFDSVADGMIREVSDSGDALEGLREKMGALSVEVTAAQQEEMKKLIRDGVNACRQSGREDVATYHRNVTDKERAIKSAENICIEGARRLKRHLDVYEAAKKAFDEFCSDLRLDLATKTSQNSLTSELEEGLEWYRSDLHDVQEEWEAATQAAEERMAKDKELYEESKERRRAQLGMLQNMARVLGLEAELQMELFGR